jgi:hypothetical protein
MSIKPITPSDIIEVKERLFPDFVLETWNKMIARKFSHGQAIIIQEEIVQALMLAGDIKRNVIFEFGYLDIEEIYRNGGWQVYYYSSPGFGLDDPYFVFIKSK